MTAGHWGASKNFEFKQISVASSAGGLNQTARAEKQYFCDS
jgi:hypothetical protein